MCEEDTTAFVCLPYPYSRYAVSDTGIILDLQTMKQCNVTMGQKSLYPGVTTWRDDKSNHSVTTFVHRLVALAFCNNNTGLPFEQVQVNHIDGNKKNYSVDNLEIVTQTDNIRHAYATGLQKHNNHVEVCCADGSMLKFDSQKAAAEYIGVCPSRLCETLSKQQSDSVCNGYVVRRVKD